MENSHALNVIKSLITKFENENKNLKLKIKEVHINNAFLEEDITRIKKTFLYKIWQIYRLFRQLFQNNQHS